MVLGSLMGGIAQGMQANRDRQDKKEQAALQKQMMALQIQNAKVAQQKEAMKSKFVERLLSEMQPTAESSAAPSDGVTMAPTPEESVAATGQPKPGGGLLERLTDMDPLISSVLSDIMGVDLAGAGRTRETMRHNATMEGMSKERLDETKRSNEIRFSELVPEEVTDASGAKVRQYRPKYGDPRLNIGGQQVAPPPVESFQYEQDGNTFEVIRELRTGKPVSEPKQIKAVKGEASETASKISLAKNALEYTKNLTDLFIMPDGSINRQLVFSANAPGGGVGDGRGAKAMFDDALDARARAATGAAMPPSEKVTYTGMYFPSPLDNDETIKNKMQRLDSFMTDYLDIMDPSGRIRKQLKRKPVRTGTYEGKKVVEYSDGSIEYAD